MRAILVIAELLTHFVVFPSTCVDMLLGNVRVYPDEYLAARRVVPHEHRGC